ncbi:MAG: sigma-70 family RNA polymerase sigma factor [Planctomycetota bacterium]
MNQTPTGELSLVAAFDRSRPTLVSNARRSLSREVSGLADASDVVQHAFLKAWEQRRKLRGGTLVDATRWLSSFVRLETQNVRRKLSRERQRRKTSHKVEQHASSEDPLASVIRAERTQRVQQAVEQLAAVERELVRGVFFDDRSIGEVAQSLGTSYWKAYRVLQRSRRKLSVALQSFAVD